MKTLRIDVTYFKNQNHTIHIGNCEWLEFRSKRYVRDFIVAYKRMLIDNAGCINLYRLQLHQIYYRNYFQCKPHVINTMDNKIADLQDNFNRIFAYYPEGNNNAFVLRKIDLCFSIILSALDILKVHGQRYKNYQIKEQVKTLIRIVEDRMVAFEKERRELDIKELSKKGKLVKLKKVEEESA